MTPCKGLVVGCSETRILGSGIYRYIIVFCLCVKCDKIVPVYSKCNNVDILSKEMLIASVNSKCMYNLDDIRNVDFISKYVVNKEPHVNSLFVSMKNNVYIFIASFVL